MTRTILAGALAALTAAAALAQQRPTFRTRTDHVSVSVSVKNRNVAVAGLTVDDFRLFDNGVLQTVERVSIEGVPIDLTLFIDTSPSFMGRANALKDDIRQIAALLRPGDRVRLIAFGNEVDEVVPWTDAGREVNLDALRIARISSVYDGLAASLLHQPGPDRRHLIVALTDGVDYNSAVSSERVLDISARVEGVLHLVLMQSAHSPLPNAPQGAYMRGPDSKGDDRLGDAAERTGGRLQSPIFSFNMVKAFQQVFDDFRTSYVLRYTPTGVRPDGWHELKVEVPKAPKATIRARRGYTG
jgi:Ca-activated chloride channel family protein